MPSEFDMIVAVKAFKELGEGVGIMRPEDEDINKMQPEAGLLESGLKEVLLKETNEQVGVPEFS